MDLLGKSSQMLFILLFEHYSILDIHSEIFNMQAILSTAVN